MIYKISKCKVDNTKFEKGDIIICDKPSLGGVFFCGKVKILDFNGNERGYCLKHDDITAIRVYKYEPLIFMG